MTEGNGRLPSPRRRDAAARFAAWCADLERPLHAYLTRLVHSREDAEDLAQDALVRVFRLWRDGGLRKEGSPRALVFGAAHNLAVDLLRRRARPVPGDAMAPAPSASSGDPLLQQEIGKALEQLPENHRRALLLREYGGLRYAEIARVMTASEGAVKVWIHRARRRLAELLDRDGQYVGDPGGKTNHDS